MLFFILLALLRHFDAIRKTANPKALQYHSGHNSSVRYSSTLTQEDALMVQQEVRLNE